MKKNIAILVCIFIITGAAAQKNFEGEITYKLHANGEDNPDAELKILFGRKAFKLRFKEKKNYDNSELLVLFDSSAQYTLNTESKTYKKTMLALKLEPPFSKTKTIASYTTTGIFTESNSLSQLTNSFMKMGNSVFYIADTLYYTIPSIFGSNLVLAAVQNNKIVLGAEIMIQTNIYEAIDSGKTKNSITIEATDVKPMNYDDSVFTIPFDYKNATYPANTEQMMDSTKIIIDSVASVRKPVKKAPKKPAKPAGKKVNTQQTIIRRKQ